MIPIDVHVGIDSAGHSDVYGGYGLANDDGIHVLDCATASRGQ